VGGKKHRITLLFLSRLAQPLVSTLDSLLAQHNDHFSWTQLLSLVTFSFLESAVTLYKLPIESRLNE
jgi:hypothetical protein